MENTDIRHDSQLIPHFADVSADKFELASAPSYGMPIGGRALRCTLPRSREEGTPNGARHSRPAEFSLWSRWRGHGGPENKKLHSRERAPPIEKNTNCNRADRSNRANSAVRSAYASRGTQGGRARTRLSQSRNRAVAPSSEASELSRMKRNFAQKEQNLETMDNCSGTRVDHYAARAPD